jgi:(p)ppGpp synthase/HD superfamily hydrolase
MTEPEPGIFDAIHFVAEAHKGHFRKGGKIPYISHLTNVMRILLENGYPDHVAIAGLLHDVVEDTPTTVEEVRQHFGERITKIVIGATEPSKLYLQEGEQEAPWKERKTHTIQYLQKEQDEEILAVCCADKVDNIRAIGSDLKRVGEGLWDRFNAPYEQQNWYYYSLLEVFLSRQGEFGEDYRKLSDEFADAVREVFP